MPIIKCDICGKSSTEGTQYWQCSTCDDVFCGIHKTAAGICHGEGIFGKLKGAVLGECPSCGSEDIRCIYIPPVRMT